MKDVLPDWERVLSAASRLQDIIPDAVLVGGTASALYAGHRQSADADHIVTDLRTRFEEILGQLESVAGWKTSRINKPVQILGSLDGIDTGIRQLIRTKPLETATINTPAGPVVLPTQAEMLRIKAALILKRNATRDYIDFVALAAHLRKEKTIEALANFDELYPQPNGRSAITQLMVQISNPKPYDREKETLRHYKGLVEKYDSWDKIQAFGVKIANSIFNSIENERRNENNGHGL